MFLSYGSLTIDYCYHYCGMVMGRASTMDIIVDCIISSIGILIIIVIVIELAQEIMKWLIYERCDLHFKVDL